MKHIVGFTARRVAKSDTWEAGYLYNTGKKRKFKRLKIFSTMEAALRYCRKKEVKK